MKKIFILLMTFVLSIASINATTIRGKLLRANTSGTMPLSGVRVDLMIWNGQTWVDKAFAITGNDGFYYFVNFQPGQLFKLKILDRFYPADPLRILDISSYQD